MIRKLRTVAALTILLTPAIWLAGCTTPAARPVLLPLPSRPALTPIKGDALQCLAPDTYNTVVNRERALRTWGLQLEATIDANNAKAKQ